VSTGYVSASLCFFDVCAHARRGLQAVPPSALRPTFPPPSSSSTGSAASYRTDMDLQHIMGDLPTPMSIGSGSGSGAGILDDERQNSDNTLATVDEDISRRGSSVMGLGTGTGNAGAGMAGTSRSPLGSPLDGEGPLRTLVVDDDK
jgi:hypothetical protein